jgi:hypothetical protein
LDDVFGKVLDSRRLSQPGREFAGAGSYTSVATIHSMPLKAAFGTCNPPSQIDTSSCSKRVQPYACLVGGAVMSAAYKRSSCRISRPCNSRVWIKSGFSKTAGAGVEGVWARHGGACVRCWRRTPSPQPTSKTCKDNSQSGPGRDLVVEGPTEVTRSRLSISRAHERRCSCSGGKNLTWATSISAPTLLSMLVGVLMSSGQGGDGLICRAGREDFSIRKRCAGR